jgi:hypothetical protein
MSNPITIRAPGKKKPGFLKRQEKVQKFLTALRGGADLPAFYEMIDFILTENEVIVPDGVDPREALFDLSQEDYEAVMANMAGGDNTVPPQNGA